MIEKLIETQNDWTGFILRLTIGIIIFAHGAQKLFGWFGGYGFSKTMNTLTTTMNLPWIIAFLVIIIESIGAFSIIVGFASRLWAIAMIGLMLGIIFFSHSKNGFFMNWFGNQAGEGYEYHLLVIGASIALFIQGSGKLSIDNLLYTK